LLAFLRHAIAFERIIASGRIEVGLPPKPGRKGKKMPNHNSGTLRRKSERVLLRIPIRVEGRDTYGQAFAESTYTLVVNRSGGLIAVSHLLQPGTVLKITNLENQVSCSFQVVMRPARSLSGTPEWGVKCLEPEVEIWGVHFPARAEEPSQAGLLHVLLECQECFSREMAALTADQYRRLVAQSSLSGPCAKCATTREWKFALMEVGLDEVSPRLPAPSASGLTPQEEVEKQGDRCLALKLPLGIRLPDGSEEASTTENISKSGLSFACNLEMHVGERIYVRVGLDSPEGLADVPARVVWRRPTKDKGRAYYGVKLERRE
jgi:hypothetical protein